MKRVADDAEDADLFGLDQFASRIHLGKPGGSIHDPVLDPLRIQLLNAAQERDSVASKSILEDAIANNAAVFSKIETKGRLLWNILRAKPAQYTAQTVSFETRLWAATHMVDFLAHGERAGYLWGVLLDALNRSDLVPASELVWARVDTLLEGDRRPEFTQDEQFLLVARLAGLVDSFQYPLIEAILTRLNACAGPDITAWAFTRCLGKYIMNHQNMITSLPKWLGSDLSEVVPFRAAHLAPLLADAGAVDAARAYWLQDNTSLYSNTSDTVPASLAEARLESEHLRAGLLVFARYPELESPHDEIIRIIYNRFELVLRGHPSLAQHNHGLLYFLARSNFYNLNSKLAKLLMELGSSPAIVATAMVTMCIRLGHFRLWREWVHIRSPKEAETNLIVDDRYAWWLFKSAHNPAEEIMNFRLPVGPKVPLMYVSYADRLIYQRYLLGLSPEGVPPKPDLPYDAAVFTDVAHPFVPAIQLDHTPISSEAYFNWSKMLEGFATSRLIGKEDLHSFHRTLLSFSASGDFEQAERFILSSYRSTPPKQDIGVCFLLGLYVHLGLYDRILPFVDKVNKKFPTKTIDSIVGEAKLVELFNTLDRKNARFEFILDLWDLCNAPPIVVFVFPILVKACIKTKNLPVGIKLAGQLSSRGANSQSGKAVKSAWELRTWLFNNKNGRAGNRLDSWLASVKARYASK